MKEEKTFCNINKEGGREESSQLVIPNYDLGSLILS